MSDGNGSPQPQVMPQIGVLGQYVKDLSFENPNAPRSITPTPTGQQPSINIQVNVDAAPMSPTDYEVTLRLEGKAESQGMLLFNFELAFAGAFRIQNVPPETLQPIVLIECPRLLFPRSSPPPCAMADSHRCCSIQSILSGFIASAWRLRKRRRHSPPIKS
jgi:preprotein translocase subunit SecB